MRKAAGDGDYSWCYYFCCCHSRSWDPTPSEWPELTSFLDIESMYSLVSIFFCSLFKVDFSTFAWKRASLYSFNCLFRVASFFSYSSFNCDIAWRSWLRLSFEWVSFSVSTFFSLMSINFVFWWSWLSDWSSFLVKWWDSSRFSICSLRSCSS